MQIHSDICELVEENLYDLLCDRFAVKHSSASACICTLIIHIFLSLFSHSHTEN